MENVHDGPDAREQVPLPFFREALCLALEAIEARQGKSARKPGDQPRRPRKRLPGRKAPR